MPRKIQNFIINCGVIRIHNWSPDSQLYSPRGDVTTRGASSTGGGGQDSLMMNILGSPQNLVYQKSFPVPNTPGNQNSPVMNTLGNPVLESQRFYVNQFWSCCQKHKDESLPSTYIHHRRVETTWRSNHRRVETPWCNPPFIKWTAGYFNYLMTWDSCLKQSLLLRNSNWLPGGEYTDDSIKNTRVSPRIFDKIRNPL